ncbi:MAG: hypothetical protein ACYC49_11235 [Ignavibacteriaceae bacterium]
MRILKGKAAYKVMDQIKGSFKNRNDGRMEYWKNGILEEWSSGTSKIIIDDKKL